MPSSNVENILYGILTGDGSGIQKPASRVEELLYAIYQNGGGGGGGTSTVYRNTTEYWNAQTDISELNAMYIYVDYDTDEHGLVPALKIGDGVHTVADLRFISAGSSAEITDEKVDKWDSNVSVDNNDLTDETLSLI